MMADFSLYDIRPGDMIVDTPSVDFDSGACIDILIAVKHCDDGSIFLTSVNSKIKKIDSWTWAPLDINEIQSNFGFYVYRNGKRLV